MPFKSSETVEKNSEKSHILQFLNILQKHDIPLLSKQVCKKYPTEKNVHKKVIFIDLPPKSVFWKTNISLKKHVIFCTL